MQAQGEYIRSHGAANGNRVHGNQPQHAAAFGLHQRMHGVSTGCAVFHSRHILHGCRYAFAVQGEHEAAAHAFVHRYMHGVNHHVASCTVNAYAVAPGCEILAPVVVTFQGHAFAGRKFQRRACGKTGGRRAVRSTGAGFCAGICAGRFTERAGLLTAMVVAAAFAAVMIAVVMRAAGISAGFTVCAAAVASAGLIAVMMAVSAAGRASAAICIGRACAAVSTSVAAGASGASTASAMTALAAVRITGAAGTGIIRKAGIFFPAETRPRKGACNASEHTITRIAAVCTCAAAGISAAPIATRTSARTFLFHKCHRIILLSWRAKARGVRCILWQKENSGYRKNWCNENLPVFTAKNGSILTLQTTEARKVILPYGKYASAS